MFIVDCLPLSKGLPKDTLSYFSRELIPAGSLIKINLRSRETHAIVTESREAASLKSEIKSASYQIKKASIISSKPFLTPSFVQAVQTTADFFAATPGAIFSQLLPQFILENPEMLSPPKNQVAAPTSTEIPALLALQVPDEERFTHYRSLVREEFARKKSVIFCVPRNEDVILAKEKLEKGIESFTFLFHNELSVKELRQNWKNARQNPHPVLIVATARWLAFPRSDFGAVVVEKENDPAWRTLSRPFIDLRFFVENWAKKNKLRLVNGDTFLRTETLQRYKNAEIGEFESVKWRLPTLTTAQVVDLKEVNRDQKKYNFLSNNLLELIAQNIQKKSQLFIFGARKGLAPITICRDCGEMVKCDNCGSSMVLYETKQGGLFRCHQCDAIRSATETCHNCNSWNLVPYGAGVDRISEEIKNIYPNAIIFQIQKEIAPSASKARKIISDFYSTPGSILVGTEMALSYLRKKVRSTAIASLDSLFAIPDFRIKEKIFKLIIDIQNLAQEKFIIQTRNPHDQTVRYALDGNLAEFYKQEIADREPLQYPPFGLFIKITVRGEKSFVIKESEFLKNRLEKYRPTLFMSMQEKKGEPAAVNAVIKMARSAWPEAGLQAWLKDLPAHFEIKVDPENLL